MEWNIIFFSFTLCSSYAHAQVYHFNQPESKDTAAAGVHWALLVAGSNGWYNYRHQADVCHAYQILKNHGLPDERIVVMMYDDIAYNEENPTPGIIINHPNGSDVYHGVPKDYTKETVTPDNFLNILQGNEEAMKGIGSGKVIKSGPNDHVFVNFVDHGAPGIVAFPDSELTSRQLNTAIKAMHKANKYKQMVFYIEACESGSMFKNLLKKNIEVYATTAANSEESSYACYMDDKRETYLGDVYSVKWMEDSDKENLNVETLHKQFKIVKKETNTSHVMQFGELSIAKESVENFQGKKEAAPIYVPTAPLNAVRSEDVPLAIAFHKLARAKGELAVAKAKVELDRIMKDRADIMKSMQDIVKMSVGDEAQSEAFMSTRSELKSYDCYEAAVRHYDRYCYDISKYDYALRQLYALVNLCERSVDLQQILKSIYAVCTSEE